MKKQIILVSSVLLFAGAGCAAVQSSQSSISNTEEQTDQIVEGVVSSSLYTATIEEGMNSVVITDLNSGNELDTVNIEQEQATLSLLEWSQDGQQLWLLASEQYRSTFYQYDVPTSELTAYQTQSSISSSEVAFDPTTVMAVYSDYPLIGSAQEIETVASDVNLYLHRLDTNKRYTIDTQSSSAYAPSLDGDELTYTDAGGETIRMSLTTFVDSQTTDFKLSIEAADSIGIENIDIPEDWAIEETQMELIESVAIHHDDPEQGRYEGAIVYPNQAQMRLNFLSHDLEYQELMESQFTGEEAVFTESEDDSPYGYMAASEETFTTIDGNEGRLFLAQADYAENHYSGAAIINHNGTYRRIGIWLGNGDMNTELKEELLTMLRSLSFSEDRSADIAE